VANCVNAAMDAMKVPVHDQALDDASRKATFDELPSGHRPVLNLGQPGQATWLS
jgi:hypothetical protein